MVRFLEVCRGDLLFCPSRPSAFFRTPTHPILPDQSCLQAGSIYFAHDQYRGQNPLKIYEANP